MVNVSTNDSKIIVNVSSAGTKGQVQAVNDLAKYYEELAHEHELSAKESELKAKDWANKLGDTVDGVEYSAKYYALETKQEHADSLVDIQNKTQEGVETLEGKREDLVNNLTTVKDLYVTELGTKGTTEIGKVNTASETAINSISTARTTAINDVNATKTSAIEQAQRDITTAKNSAISSVDAEANTQKQELQIYVNQASNYANNAKTSETNAHNSELACQNILERLGTAIKIKGRVDSLTDLPTIGNLDGDAYLVGEEGLSSYPEYYWYNNHWEFLGTSGGGGTWGTITGDITAQTDLKNALDEKVGFTDYATGSTGGVVKTSGTYAITTSNNGYLQAQVKTKDQYDSLSTASFISKGTLENIKDDLVTSIGDSKYQYKLTAGANISIENNEISVTGDLGAEIIMRTW